MGGGWGTRSQTGHPPVVKGAVLFLGVFGAQGNILLFSHLANKRSKNRHGDYAPVPRDPNCRVGDTLSFNKAPSVPPLFWLPAFNQVRLTPLPPPYPQGFSVDN